MMKIAFNFPLSLAGLVLLGGSALAIGSSDLLTAVRNHDREGVRLLVGKVDVNAAEPDGSTALLLAAQSNDLETVNLLLKAGANPQVANRYGATPLSAAATYADKGVVESLLKAGANPEVRVTRSGQTVLMTASRVGNVGAVTALLDRGVDVNAKESDRGQTALMWAAAEGHPEVVSLLMSHGADPKIRSVDRNTAGARLQSATPVANVDRGGLTALMLAARQGQVGSSRALLEGGADANQTDPDGNNALVLAVLNVHYDVANLLLDRGADPNLANKQGRTALYTAVDIRNRDLSPLPARSETDTLSSMDFILSLLKHGANVNARLTAATPISRSTNDPGDKTLAAGATPFMRAARSTDIPLMRVLLEHGADPKLGNTDGLNPLMVAAGLTWTEKIRGTEAEALATVKWLADLGLDVNAATKAGDTALHGAAYRGADSIVRYLIDKGAKVNAANTAGLTPLDIALNKDARVGKPGVIRESTAALLREKGGKPGERKAGISTADDEDDK
jgi:uncharacterized protein